MAGTLPEKLKSETEKKHQRNRSFLSDCCRVFGISARRENDFVAFRGRTSSAPSGRGYRKSFLLWVRTVAVPIPIIRFWYHRVTAAKRQKSKKVKR
jgi:hypothetical protein